MGMKIHRKRKERRRKQRQTAKILKKRRRYCNTALSTLYTTTTISKPNNTVTTLDNTQQTPMHNTWLDPVVNCRQSFQGQKDNKVKKSVSFNNKPEIKTFESEKESRTTKTVRKTVKKIVQPGRVRRCQTELNNFLSNLINSLLLRRQSRSNQSQSRKGQRQWHRTSLPWRNWKYQKRLNSTKWVL